MTAVASTAATALTGAGVICLLVATVFAGSWRQGLHMALDLWVAGGLLRLTSGIALSDLLMVAAIIAVRQLLTRALRAGNAYLAATDRPS